MWWIEGTGFNKQATHYLSQTKRNKLILIIKARL